MDGGHSIRDCASCLSTGLHSAEYRDPLEALRRLAGRVRHVYWLNPEPQHDWDTTDSVMSGYAPLRPGVRGPHLRQLVACVDETTTPHRRSELTWANGA
jgi:uncharacterized protein with von Willebrand factor type A (vWA) domain